MRANITEIPLPGMAEQTLAYLEICFVGSGVHLGTGPSFLWPVERQHQHEPKTLGLRALMGEKSDGHAILTG